MNPTLEVMIRLKFTSGWCTAYDIVEEYALKVDELEENI